MSRRRRPAWTRQPAPWTREEDARLAEMLRVGLASDFWPAALPGRRFGEMLERRLDLALPMAPLL